MNKKETTIDEVLKDPSSFWENDVIILNFEKQWSSKIDLSWKILNILNYKIKDWSLRAKILLNSFLDQEYLLKNYGTQAEEFFGHKNTWYIRLPYSKDDLDQSIKSLWKTKITDQMIFDKAIAQNVFLRVAEIKHYLKFDASSKEENLKQTILTLEWQNNKFIYSSKQNILEYIQELQIIFPPLKSKSPIEIITRLAKTNFTIPEVAKWKSFSGVYVDVDGTLFERVAKWSEQEWSQIINQEVLQKLQEYEKQWKEVYIFTWWNLQEKQKLLDKFGIKYKLVSKYDMAWWEAEIVIDDTEDKNKFFIESKIFAKEYIPVQRFLKSDT